MKKIFFALMLGLAAVACTTAEYDDTAIKEQLGELDGRLDKVEEELATLQLNVDAMKSLAQALKDGKYITSYVALEDNTGYTINFSDNTSIVIEKGEKGDKGETGDTGETGQTGPAGKDAEKVTVAEKDGELYWFIGEVAQIPVYEAAPVFTSVDGKLYVQFGDKEPEEIGTLTGKSIFEDVKVEGNEMVFTFLPVGEEAEGLVYRVPLAEKFALVIDAEVGLAENATEAVLAYEVKGANATTVVDVLAHGCEAVVEADVIKVTAIVEGATLLVFADNGEGKTSIKKVTFAPESFEVSDVDEVVSFKGGSVEVAGVTNIAFEVVIPEAAQSWLSCVETKAAFSYTFTAAPNTVEETRSAEVSFVRFGTEEVLKTVTIEQAAYVPFAKLVWDAAVPFGGGKDRNMTMDSEYVYVAQAAGGDGAVKAISIADPTQVKDVKVTTYTPAGLDNGTHAVTCVRMLPNSNPEVNGGKPVLVGSNLTTGDGTEKLIVYVWSNGIDADPNYFVIDSGTRRLGDKFTVKGTYQAGELHFFDFNDGNAVIRVKMTDGVAGEWGTPELTYATGRYAVPVAGAYNIGECTIHPDATFDANGNPSAVLLTTNAVNGFFTQDSGNAFVASAWGTDPKLTQTYGYNFFEHNGVNYIAYVKVAGDRNSAALNVIEDVNGAADFKGTLEAQKDLFTAPVNGTGNAGHGLGDCATAVVDGVRYIAVMGQNIGISLYKVL